MRTITLTAYKRPALFKRTLQSLVANPLDGWRVVVRIEPSPLAGAIAAIAASLLAECESDIAVNDRLLGVRGNPLAAIDGAFAAGATLNVALEEDLDLAPDALALASWYERHHRDGWLCLCLLAGPCGTPGLLSDPRWPATVFEGHWFNALGFAVREPEWRRSFKPAWNRDQTSLDQPGMTRPPRGWDWSIYALAVAERLSVVAPVLARATHTGRDGGTWCLPEVHDRLFGDLPTARQAVPDFTLLARGSLPREVRVHAELYDEITRFRGSLARRRNPVLRLLGR